jgi:hypothetical protein
MPIPFYIYCIAFSLLVGIICFRQLKPFHLQAFVPFLALTLIVELAGVYMKYVLDTNNGALYNGYIFVQVVFCSVFLRGTVHNSIHRRIITAGLAIYIIASLTSFYYNGLIDFNREMFLLGGFNVALSCIFFLLNYFATDSAQEAARYEPVVWIAVGLIAYFAVLSITVSLKQYILLYDLKIGGIMLHNVVPRAMSIIMYLCFAFSFYRCRKNQT